MKTMWPLYLIGAVTGQLYFSNGLVFEPAVLLTSCLFLIFLN